MDQEKGSISVLLALTREMVEILSLDEALHAVTEAALKLLPGDHASIRVFDDSGTDLLCGARSGEGVSERPLVFTRGEGVAGWVAEHGRVAVVQDTAADPRFKHGGGLSIRSIVAVPLWSAGEVVGVLGVTSSRACVFSTDDQNMAVLLANCAVPHIEKARKLRLAVTDRLTKAYHRRYLLPRLREETRRAGRYDAPLCVMGMRLDGFGERRDRHGRTAAAKIVRRFAERLRSLVRRTDVLVRRKGEEFVLIAPFTERGEALDLANVILRDMMARGLDCGGGLWTAPPVSIGVAVWNGREPAESLDGRALQAVAQASAKGGNCVEVAPDTIP